MMTKSDARTSLEPPTRYIGVESQTEKGEPQLRVITGQVLNIVTAQSFWPPNIEGIAPVEWSRKSPRRAKADDADEDLRLEEDEELNESDYITEAEIDRKIADYEQMYGMSSDEFLQAWENNTAPDTFETNSWARMLDYKRGKMSREPDMSSKFDDVTFEFPEMKPHDRLWQLVLHIARASEGDVAFSKVKLVKILYFSDATSFLRRGKPISGAKYIKLPYGPFPDDFNALLNEMETNGAIAIRTLPYFNYEQIKVFALRGAELNKLFEAEDIALVDEIIRNYWNTSAADMSNLSHGIAWRSTKDNAPIPYEASLLSDEGVTEDDISHVQRLITKYGL